MKNITFISGKLKYFLFTMFLCMASATILAQSSLHIELTAFTAKEMNGMVMINWTIESQKDCNYFTIERTGDGQSVTPVGIVDADGTTIQSMDYSFNDVNPETDTDYYYRIKETDFDGNTHTFHWIPVVKEQEESEFTVFPNPANSNITLNFPSNGKDAVCHILKEDGRIVEEQTISTSPTDPSTFYYDNISKLPKGLYIISVHNGTKTYSKKLIKQ